MAEFRIAMSPPNSSSSWSAFRPEGSRTSPRRSSAIYRGSSTTHASSMSATGDVWPPASSPPPPLVTTSAAAASSPLQAATILLNGAQAPSIDIEEPTKLDLNSPSEADDKEVLSPGAQMEQSAQFFDPKNRHAAELREKVAMDTLEELLDFLLVQNGSVGILDATNSTIYRRQLLVRRIREREPKLGILFIESICHDQDVSYHPSFATAASLHARLGNVG